MDWAFILWASIFQQLCSWKPQPSQGVANQPYFLRQISLKLFSPLCKRYPPPNLFCFCLCFWWTMFSLTVEKKRYFMRPDAFVLWVCAHTLDFWALCVGRIRHSFPMWIQMNQLYFIARKLLKNTYSTWSSWVDVVECSEKLAVCHKCSVCGTLLRNCHLWFPSVSLKVLFHPFFIHAVLLISFSHSTLIPLQDFG